jgi:predicted DNA-binding transcriptional regulator YafY
MSVNKLALIRYKTIDECLKNRFRNWTLDDLIDKVAEALYEYEGIDSGISKRTIQLDIQNMRSEKLGYNAPIVVVDRKFYTYENEDYSITNSPINNADMEKMKEIVSVLKHLNGFSYFDEMSDMIIKLENNLNKSSKKTKNYIQFENNKLLKGLEKINPLYQAILNQKPLLIEYKSFKAQASSAQIYFPYLLKEYRNRWFLICKPKEANHLITLALDRIENFETLENEHFKSYDRVDFDTYFDDVIGVTKSLRDESQQVIFIIDSENAPYVKTKPIHESQEIICEDENGTTFSIQVVLNFELEREILGFAENIKVVSPRLLVKKIQRRIERANLVYQKNID